MHADEDDIPSESSNVALLQRSFSTQDGYSYIGIGAKLVITRDGVITQWKFFSENAGGVVVFQVWRETGIDRYDKIRDHAVYFKTILSQAGTKTWKRCRTR